MDQPVVPLTPLKSGITLEFMARQAPELARDIVSQLDNASNLAAAYGLTPEQWAVLRDWPAFRTLVTTAMTEMAGTLGAAERIKRKALMALDQCGILDAATIAGNPKTADKTRLDAIEVLMLAGGLTSKTQQAGGGGGGGPLFVINLTGLAPVTMPVAGSPRPVIEAPTND